MFPPQEHNTGNAGFDAMLRREEEQTKNGFNTGNKDRDNRLNESRKKGLQQDEERGKALGMSGKEYREIDAIKNAFDNSEQGKELNKKYADACKQFNKTDENGIRRESPEAKAARREMDKAEAAFVKNNFNDKTYQNYCKRQQNNPFFSQEVKDAL